MNNIWQFILTLVNVDQVGLITALLIGNFITGALSGVFTGTFDWSKLKDIWKKAAIMYGAYLMVAVLSTTLVMLGWGNTWEVPRTAMCVAITAALIDAIMKNLAQMGLPIPAGVAELPGVKQVFSKLAVKKAGEVG